VVTVSKDWTPDEPFPDEGSLLGPLALKSATVAAE